jgi:transposase-like protein
MKTQREVSLETANKLRAWYEKNEGKVRKWGAVTVENLAAQIGVTHNTIYLWFRAARTDAEEGKLPQGLSVKAINKFLSSNK